ncbi:hypothetical protein P8452_59895 [Trifolium repens]|nr:hypothetical protein P8452_59895 [Trifolium repens]
MVDVAPVRSFSSPAWFHAFRCMGGAAVFMGSRWCCSDLVTFGVVMVGVIGSSKGMECCSFRFGVVEDVLVWEGLEGSVIGVGIGCWCLSEDSSTPWVLVLSEGLPLGLLLA